MQLDRGKLGEILAGSPRRIWGYQHFKTGTEFTLSYRLAGSWILNGDSL
jgi:hypothetical protein